MVARRRGRRHRFLSAGLLALLALSLALGPGPRPAAAAPAAVVPPGFSDSLVASVGAPTAVAFTPDGRMLVTRQAGELRVYHAGSLALARVAVSLQPILCYNEERGLLGLAVDPDFAANRYLYLFYSYKKGGVCPDGDIDNPNNPVNRVSRFVLQDDNRVLTTTETVLLDNLPTVDGDHNGGDLKFGPDGYLYVSVGDNDCNYAGSGLCGSGNEAARDEFILLGKILRLTRDGGIPPDNPFQGPGTARCHLTGRTDPGQRCQETYAWGLRNPFRMAFDPNAAGTRFFINDVGQNQREEINLGQAGADYGWNCLEGTRTNSTTGKCSPTPAGLAAPIHEYTHGSGCASITGGAFVPNGLWPPEFDNSYLFSDYVCGKIFRLSPAPGGGYTASDFVTGLGGSSAVDMRFGPYGSGQALYYTTYASGGQVRRIAYDQAPSAVLSAAPASGPLPLAVSFDGSGSSDPSGHTPLSYDWDFGDGAAQTGTSSPTRDHTYTTAGVYTATLVVRNSLGVASAPASVVIAAGTSAPQPVISLPAQDATFAVGERVTLAGSASDAEDGALPPAALSWEVRLHHVDAANPGSAHWHPHFTLAGAAGAAFTAPAPEDLSAAALSYVEVRLTATDSDGLQATASRVLQPRRVAVSVASEPSGLALALNGESFAAPRAFTLWEGWRLPLQAPASQAGGGGQTWIFSRWSHGGGAAQTLVAPAAPATFTAIYSTTARLWVPLVMNFPAD